MPPFAAERALASVSTPVEEKLEVAVAPNEAFDAPKARVNSDVEVAEPSIALVVLVKLVEKRFPAVKAVDDAFTRTDVLVEEVALIQPTVGELEALRVMVPPRETVAPPVRMPEELMVMDEFVRSAFATLAHVAAPAPLSERTNWLVQEEPP